MNTSITLYPVLPFRLDYTVWALRRRDKNIVDQWDGRYYSRLFFIENRPIKMMIEQDKHSNHLKIFLSASIPVTKAIKEKYSTIVEEMLGIKKDLQPFYIIAKQHTYLKSIVDYFMGLKPPRYPSIFEALVNAVSCQQISLDAGLQIQNRLIQYINLSSTEHNQIYYAFPRPADIANCTVSNLKKVGYSSHKSETLIQLASKLAEDESIFENIDAQSNNDIINLLCQFKGIGRWSAEYALLRGLGRMDIFPSNDSGAQKNLQRFLHLDEKLTDQKIQSITAKWQPYAGFVYLHLLLNSLREKGVL